MFDLLELENKIKKIAEISAELKTKTTIHKFKELAEYANNQEYSPYWEGVKIAFKQCIEILEESLPKPSIITAQYDNQLKATIIE